ncbi:Telomerase reverse transcriptase [Ophidiomyces ophidiicola]|nr:Telomerase reverse transcriptase [Ophidiomyces ophidiicola]KAI2201710.1 Telomerase reverse transcriptase [Ophidiomyces ophidiicola]KAI2400752.1 Telomerase reverse transcriptase [Ophidiomyces ophidiicola]
MANRPRKRPRPDSPTALPDSLHPTHPVLARFYARVVPLRVYLLAQLPPSSRARRRRLAAHAHHDDELTRLLDDTLVGVLTPRNPGAAAAAARQRDFAAFSQSQSARDTTAVAAASSVVELVDFAVLALFRAHRGPYARPAHLLCHGFARAAPAHPAAPAAALPGLVPLVPNPHVSRLKAHPWPALLDLLGAAAEDLLLHLLLDCGLFTALDRARGTYCQLSGIPLVDLPLLDPANTTPPADRHSPHHIVFVRNRMLYARPELNAQRRVKLGLQHIHVLNRYRDCTNPRHTLHVMKYIFPRQFGLHNVFTSAVDPKTTVQPFKDYTLREDEIAAQQNPNKLPKRLRGLPLRLVQKLQKRHQRCSYVELLKYYCPIQGPPEPDPDSAQPMTSFATPMALVSAFCRAALQKVVPNDLFGTGEDGQRNRAVVMRQVDRFIHLRRFESLSLHEVAQGLKISCIEWLAPPQQQTTKKPCLSDARKRREIFLELLYYLFDSLLIPLVRANFYVTESSAHRNRLFYFRHDRWRALVAPSLARLTTSVFEEVDRSTAARHALGCSALRMLPKRAGARPIANLRRRPVVVKARWPGGNKKTTELGPSINMLLAPVFQTLNYEKARRPALLGAAAMGGVGDMHLRLKRFREALLQRNASDGGAERPLYFVKLDVQACFDTIPQKRLLRLVEQLVSEDEYRLSKYAEVGVPYHSFLGGGATEPAAKPARKFVSRAAASMDFQTAYDFVRDSHGRGATRSNTVFVDIGQHRRLAANDVLALLEQHVRHHVVRIGRKFFRQARGIPQGSVVSGALCNLFYAQHERERLAFVQRAEDRAPGSALLLRLIDDYLLVTTAEDVARRFLRVMLAGDPDYGISVAPGKTLVNFAATTTTTDPAAPILRVVAGRQFPFCAHLIDTRTLAVSKDRRAPDPDADADNHDLHLRDTLTVDTAPRRRSLRRPGAAFASKSLAGFKLQLHAMFVDPAHNAPRVVLAAIHAAFVDTAMKMHAYFRVLQRRRRRRSSSSSSTALFTRTVAALLAFAVPLVRRLQVRAANSTSSRIVPGAHVRWLGVQAFRAVLARKPSGMHAVVRWLAAQTPPIPSAAAAGVLRAVVRDGQAAVRRTRF